MWRLATCAQIHAPLVLAEDSFSPTSRGCQGFWPPRVQNSLQTCCWGFNDCQHNLSIFLAIVSCSSLASVAILAQGLWARLSPIAKSRPQPTFAIKAMVIVASLPGTGYQVRRLEVASGHSTRIMYRQQPSNCAYLLRHTLCFICHGVWGMARRHDPTG